MDTWKDSELAVDLWLNESEIIGNSTTVECAFLDMP